MPKWIPCGDGFIEADVIRWKEGVWRRPKRKGRRAVRLGDCIVTAEVIRDEEGWVDLLIRGYAVSNEIPGRKVEVPAKGTEIRRKRSTIERGKPERLPWSDETARAALARQFLGNRKSSSSASMSFLTEHENGSRIASRGPGHGPRPGGRGRPPALRGPRP